MNHLNPAKLNTHYLDGSTPYGPASPRAYTLTHSDATGDLYLTIGQEIHHPQISGWYTRLMRDEVLARWSTEAGPALHVHCHVSGGLVLGSAGWRDSIFRKHLPMVLEAFYYGDRALCELHPSIENAPVIVHFHSSQPLYDRVENWGSLSSYRLPTPMQPAFGISA